VSLPVGHVKKEILIKEYASNQSGQTQYLLFPLSGFQFAISLDGVAQVCEKKPDPDDVPFFDLRVWLPREPSFAEERRFSRYWVIIKNGNNQVYLEADAIPTLHLLEDYQKYRLPPGLIQGPAEIFCEFFSNGKEAVFLLPSRNLQMENFFSKTPPG
jgi:hypothetical protein